MEHNAVHFGVEEKKCLCKHYALLITHTTFFYHPIQFNSCYLNSGSRLERELQSSRSTQPPATAQGAKKGIKCELPTTGQHPQSDTDESRRNKKFSHTEQRDDDNDFPYREEPFFCALKSRWDCAVDTWCWTWKNERNVLLPLCLFSLYIAEAR